MSEYRLWFSITKNTWNYEGQYLIVNVDIKERREREREREMIGMGNPLESSKY